MKLKLTDSEREQIAEVLERRANDIATFKTDNKDAMPGSVELGLLREMRRLRRLADKVKPPEPEDDDE